MRASTVISSSELETLDRLGQTVRLARLRRNLSQTDLADRMGVTRPSVVALESGKPGVGIGILLKALSVLGYSQRLGDLVATDPIGDDIATITGRRRASRETHVANF